MKRVILFGAPGSGKGTQSGSLSEFLRVNVISLGDILRKEVKDGTALGGEVKGFMEKGLLVSDELVGRVIEANLNPNGFVLDGYPRNVAQAENLEAILKTNNCDIDAFIYFDVDESTVIERLSKRRICKQCGALYHLKNMPPQKCGVCDKCAGELYQRKDDNPETIKKRWEVFLEENQGLVDFYTSRNKLIKVDARGQKDDVFERIKPKLQ
ncbi:MAG: adenylate kinase [Candidatus Omnitrophica bacterium]|nr:adenylate kinase [Candidatus Omnitrophota bacterium]